MQTTGNDFTMWVKAVCNLIICWRVKAEILERGMEVKDFINMEDFESIPEHRTTHLLFLCKNWQQSDLSLACPAWRLLLLSSFI